MAVDYLGLAIFLIGIALMVAELAQPGYFIGVAGTTGVIVGLVQMAWPAFLKSNYSPFVIVAVALVATAVSVEFYRRLAPANKPPETLSSDALLGQRGRVVVPTESTSVKGKVKLGGIVWSATSDAPIPTGTDVVVVRVEGVHLHVTPVPSAPPAPPAPEPAGEPHG